VGADWRYLAYRLNGDGTETLIDPDLPLQDVSLTRVISGPAGMSAKIGPAAARLIGTDGQPIMQRYSTALYAEKDGKVVHGTILTDMGRNGSELSLTGTGFSAFPQGEPYDGDVFYVQADPLDIYRAVWTKLQGQPRRNIGMVLGATKTGLKIGTKLDQVQFDTQAGPVSFEAGPVKLNWWEVDDLGSFLDNLATENNFDYMESHNWDSDDQQSVEHHLDFGYPRIGKRRDDLRFVVGENVTTQPGESYAGASYCSEVLVRGAGEGRTMIRGFATRTGETRLGRMQVVEDKQIKSVTAANKRAQVELAMRQGKPEVSNIIVREMPGYPNLGSWQEGDDIELVTDGEWGGSADYYRVLSTTITPEDPSVANLAVRRADMIPA
jgi:hypothetical protein